MIEERPASMGLVSLEGSKRHSVGVLIDQWDHNSRVGVRMFSPLEYVN